MTWEHKAETTLLRLRPSGASKQKSSRSRQPARCTVRADKNCSSLPLAFWWRRYDSANADVAAKINNRCATVAWGVLRRSSTQYFLTTMKLKMRSLRAEVCETFALRVKRRGLSTGGTKTARFCTRELINSRVRRIGCESIETTVRFLRSAGVRWLPSTNGRAQTAQALAAWRVEGQSSHVKGRTSRKVVVAVSQW